MEASTGPLGQGLGNAVGMAIGEAHLAARYNRPGHEIFSHRTFVLASDGDLMEGVARRGRVARRPPAARAPDRSLRQQPRHAVGHDVASRSPRTSRPAIAAYGWHVDRVADGNDVEAIDRALRGAIDEDERPSLIIVDTVIGYGAPNKSGTFEAHGSPLGAEETERTKRNLGWPTQPTFFVPPEAAAHLARRRSGARSPTATWRKRFAEYAREFPDLAAEIARRFEARLPDRWAGGLPVFAPDEKGMATRKASEGVLQELARTVPELIGGSGDLDPSTFSWLKKSGDFEAASARAERRRREPCGGGWSYAGRNIHFGVREHAMGAAVNGLAYHGGFIPFGATFLVFSDYMRPADPAGGAVAPAVDLRVHARQHRPGRRRADAPGGRAAGGAARDSRAAGDPSRRRQRDARRLAGRDRDARSPDGAGADAPGGPDAGSRARSPTAEGLRRGAYVLDREPAGGPAPDVILIASGSELSLAVAAADRLRAEARSACASCRCRAGGCSRSRPRPTRTPCCRRRSRRGSRSRRARRSAGTASSATRGAVVGIDRFGASAPGEVVMREYGFTPEHVADVARGVLG